MRGHHSPALRSRLLVLSLGVFGLAFYTPSARAQDTGKRVALIIGNNNYTASPLKNAVNDARLMDQALRAAGFRTVLRENATKAAMEEATAEFLQQLGPDDTALFFYAGHGIQIESENFLVPVDFEAATSIIQAKFRCFSMAQVFDALKNRPKRSIVILDACRSNPVAELQSLQAGLAQPQTAGKETYIAFSTGPGQVAADNPVGRNSWFTEALADLIGQQGLTIEEVFTRVRSRVSGETDGRQTPWSTSNLTARFYFHAPQNGETDNDPTLAEKWIQESRRREQREDWPEAIDLINQVLKKKPGGALEAAAASRLPYLTARRDAQARYEAQDFAGAAKLYEEALRLDPFMLDAAFQGVNSYLLDDRLPEALRLLQAIRVRGTTASIEKANVMLKELAAVDSDAGKILQETAPAPPPIEQVFGGVNFGVPDWDAGTRYLQTAAPDLSRWSKELTEAFAPPAAAAPAGAPAVTSAPTPAPAAGATASAATATEPTAAAVQIAKEIFHVDIVTAAETRDLAIRKVGEPKYGFVELNGPENQTPVVVDGSVVAQQVPAKFRLAAGKYEVRGVQNGQVVFEQKIEVTEMGVLTLNLRQP